MARKDINVFNVAFLDLLSGALGAVLLLFIVIPKLDASISKKLEKLESIEELEVDAQDIQSMMKQLQSSVSQTTYNGLEVKVKNLNAHLASLGSETERLQQLLGQCQDERAAHAERIKKLVAEVEQLRAKLQQDTDVNQDLLQENTELKETITKKDKSITYGKKKIESLESDIEDLNKELETAERRKELYKDELEKQQEEIEALKKEQVVTASSGQELQEAKNKVQELSEKLSQYEEKLGLKFKDKNVVFVVDISGSMVEAPESEKLNEVKAGIKMLIANMDETYKVDIVIFPKSTTEDYDYLYGKLKPITETSKYELYNFISSLQAHYCTPTRSVMDFVFKSNKYNDAGTITFFSDGVPTARDGTACPDDPIDSVVGHITTLNKGKRVINTIGVGRDYRKRGNNIPKVRFMKDLAGKNKGFFMGF